MLTTNRLGMATLLLFASAAFPQSPEKQAQALLGEAKVALQAGDTATSSRLFNEVIQKFPATLSAKQARYALAMDAFHGTDPDYPKIVESLTVLHNAWDFPERAEAVYYTGAALRMIGLKEQALAYSRPEETLKFQANAKAKFEEARTKFEAARDALGKKNPEWEGRCRCDKAEMSIRMNKPKEAIATCEVFAKDPEHIKLKIQPLGLYYLGLASFLDGDMKSAGRHLNRLAPFRDPDFGLHARYLVGRIHHTGGEAQEASVHYEAVLDGFQKAGGKGPAPDYVAGATFHLAGMSYESGKYPEALEKLQTFVKAHPDSPLVPDARLRIGCCQFQRGAYEDAIGTLQPIVEKSPQLADQAQLWLGKSILMLALANTDSPAREKLKLAVETIQSAQQKTAQLAGQNDPEAKLRKHEFLLELADGLYAAKRFAEAVPIYRQLWIEKLIPTRGELLLQRYAFAAGAAGDLEHSDELLGEFRKKFSQSPLLPAVLYRHAENGYGRATAAEKQHPTAPETRHKWESTASKFADVYENHPDSERAAQSRYAAGICHLRLGNLAQAEKALEGIPQAQRIGELATAGNRLADVYLQQSDPEKWIAAATLLGESSRLAKNTEVPVALWKLGRCYQQLASSTEDLGKRREWIELARQAFDRLSKEFPNDALADASKVARAKLGAIHGDVQTSIRELQNLHENSAKNDLLAVQAGFQIAFLHRRQGKSEEAVRILADLLRKYEPSMAKDPVQKDLLQFLKFHLAMAQMETGKLREARTTFDTVLYGNYGKPIGAEAALCSGRCGRLEGRALIAEGKKIRELAGNDAGARNRALDHINTGRTLLSQAAEHFANQSQGFRSALPQSQARARMLYEAAQIDTELAVDEIAFALKEWQKKNPASPMATPGVIPPTRYELRSKENYRRLMEEFPESGLALEARLELADWHTHRAEHADAIVVLKAALETEAARLPAHQGFVESVRMQLGSLLQEQGQFKEAAVFYSQVLANIESPRFLQASLSAAECHLLNREAAKAVACLAPVCERGEGKIADRADLLLGQAYGQLKQPEKAEQSLQRLLKSSPESPYASEAEFRLGESMLSRGRAEEGIERLVAVASNTDSGEFGAAAKLLLAKAHAEAGRPELARPLLHELIETVGVEPAWQRAAKERLEKLPAK